MRAPAGATAVLEAGPDASLTALTLLATRLCAVPSAVVNIVDNQYQYQVATTGLQPMTCPVAEALCAHALADRALVVVADARDDPRYRDNAFVDGRYGRVRFYASAPLLTTTGHVLGTLSVVDSVPGTLTDDQQDSLGILAAQVVEVLELRRQTRWLDLALPELTRSNAVLTDFAGRLSHDLKTPLTTVLGFAEVLEVLPAVESDERAVRCVGRILRSGNRMRELIDDLLSFAAVGGKTTAAPVALRPLVTAVVDDLAPLVRRRKATVMASDTTVQADPVQLWALVQNLVENALKYGAVSDAVDTDRTVEVVARPTGVGWDLCVIDHGPGVPTEQRNRMLEPLTRLDRDVAEPGSGIGLATCRRIAQAMGGTLEIGETTGGGTTVTVSMPA